MGKRKNGLIAPAVVEHYAEELEPASRKRTRPTVGKMSDSTDFIAMTLVCMKKGPMVEDPRKTTRVRSQNKTLRPHRTTENPTASLIKSTEDESAIKTATKELPNQPPIRLALARPPLLMNMKVFTLILGKNLPKGKPLPPAPGLGKFRDPRALSSVLRS